jgi:dethiobiotin synthetase
MAAEALGDAAFTISDLIGELTWPEGIEVGFVEGAGGVRSPLAADGDAIALAAALRPDIVLLVAEAGLGVLNLVRLSAHAIDHPVVLVHLNRFDPAEEIHQRNWDWLQRDGTSVETSVDALARRLSRRS